jgi:hypothetical protein
MSQNAGGVVGSQPMSTAVQYTEAQINFRDLTPYLTYGVQQPLYLPPHTNYRHRVNRVSGFLSSRPYWVPPPLTRKRVLIPPMLGPRWETHSLARDGVGRPNSDEGTDTLVLYVYYCIIPLRTIQYPSYAGGMRNKQSGLLCIILL